MSVKWKHDDNPCFYFCSFTCYKWLPLFEQTKSYEAVYKWFNYLSTKNIHVTAYAIMPNHLHLLIYFPEPGYDLNKIISNAKRFLTYEVIKRLKANGNHGLLSTLSESVTAYNSSKGQLHKGFQDSFDAKPVYSEPFFMQKLEYIHYNPVKGKWQLASDFTEYEHSSASFYEKGVVKNFRPFDFRSL